MTPADIRFVGLDPSPALADAVRDKLAKLRALHAGLLSCRVTIELAARHATQGRPIAVHIETSLPGQPPLNAGAQDEDAHVALRDAFDALRRQLDDDAGRARAQRHSA